MKTETGMNSGSRRAGRLPALAAAGMRFACLLALAALGACATAPASAPSPDEQVLERAQARWDALLADQLETAYSYYSPGYRSTVSVINFGTAYRLRRVKFISAQYREHSCEDTRCSVKFDVGYSVTRPVPGVDKFEHTQVIEDIWVKSGDEWWYLPKK